MANDAGKKPQMNGPEPMRSWPRAFRALGLKINELCAWIGGIEAGQGITITKSRARTIIAVNRVQTSGPSGTGTGSEGDPIDVVGSDGKLNTVPKHSTWASPTGYPTVLKTVDGSVTCILGADGLQIKLGSDFIVELNPNTGIMYFANPSSGKTIQIDLGDVTEDMGIKTVAVCDSGSPADMLVVGSDPF